MSTNKIKLGNKDIPFVFRGDELVYPNPIKDGLLLWYDFKGMRNTDTSKEVAKDLSGNGNDGTLTNFNFTDGSGYKDNTLIFDGVDDSLTIPELVLDETAMTATLNEKTYSYEDDKVLSVDEDGEVVGGGINLIPSFKSDKWQAIHPLGMSSIEDYSLTFRPKENYVARFNIYLDKFTDYTFSFNSDYQRYYIYELNSDDSLSTMIRTVSQGSDVYTFNTGEHNYFQIMMNSWSQNLDKYRKVWNIKLEKGSVATPWTPSPEDFKSTEFTPSSITNLQLYNKTLSKDELLHNAESKGLKKLKPDVVVQDGLVLHYDFSKENNHSEYRDKAFDYSGNGNHGTLQNFNYTEESGYVGKGLKFDGVDDYISRGTIPDYEVEYSTYEITLNRIHDSRAYQRIIERHNYWVDGLFYSSNSLRNYLSLFGGGGSITQILPVLENIPIHIVRTLDLSKGGSKIYINGVLKDTRDSLSGTLNERANSGSLIIGRDSLSTFNSVKIYNRPLTEEEIQHNYQIEKEKFNIE